LLIDDFRFSIEQAPGDGWQLPRKPKADEVDERHCVPGHPPNPDRLIAVQDSMAATLFKMSVYFFFVVLATVTFCSCGSQQETHPLQIEKPQPPKTIVKPPVEAKQAKPPVVANPPSMSFIHSCYIYAYKLQSRQYLEQIRFDQFNIIYLIAVPRWSADEFGGSGATAFSKYVTADIYPAGDKGMSLVPELIDLAHQYKVKVLLCLQDRDFPNVVKETRSRDNFVNTMTAIVKKYNYDGIEVDWEDELDLTAHLNLMAAFRGRLDAIENESANARDLYLTTAVLAGKKYSAAGAAKLSRLADWINVMTYDLGGALYGDKAVHNASPVGVKKVLANWAMFNPNKICVGLPSYGYLYRNLKPGQKCYRPITDFGQSIHYNQLSSLLSSGWKESYDAAARASYYFSPDGKSFVTIDNPLSIDRKMDFITAGRYRGVFWWEFYCDLTQAAPGQGQFTHDLIDPVESRIRTMRPALTSR
jgi:chitinase